MRVNARFEGVTDREPWARKNPIYNTLPNECRPYHGVRVL